MSRMRRHARGDLDSPRPPMSRGAQSRADRGRVAGRETPPGDGYDRVAPSPSDRRDAERTGGRGARER